MNSFHIYQNIVPYTAPVYLRNVAHISLSPWDARVNEERLLRDHLEYDLSNGLEMPTHFKFRGMLHELSKSYHIAKINVHFENIKFIELTRDSYLVSGDLVNSDTKESLKGVVGITVYMDETKPHNADGDINRLYNKLALALFDNKEFTAHLDKIEQEELELDGLTLEELGIVE